MSDETETTIRQAVSDDEAAVLDLMPMLADFDLPGWRDPKDLWQGDAQLVRQHFAGDADQTRLVVAERDDAIVGLALVLIGEELLSHAPSAHLEAIVVAPQGRGVGLGRRLMHATEELAVAESARTLTLNAFRTNVRARNLYESLGFDGELIRYIKPLATGDAKPDESGQ
jgi:ribosomal protein S18 acetylase RimI-like enzyme